MTARRRTAWVALAGLVAVGAAAGSWLRNPGGPAAEADDAAVRPTTTAQVTRATIAATRSFAGTLGYGEAFTVTTSAHGVVTGIAEQGVQVHRGDELFRVNERPVTALFGAIPMYRDLAHGDHGADVEQLIANLTALGRADCDATDEITWCVREAIRSWQGDLGVEVTGRLAQSDVVFVPQRGRVDTLHAGVGALVSPGAAVLDLTGVAHVVSLEVQVRDRTMLPVGAEVTVALPGGETVAATVTAAKVVPAGSDQGGNLNDAIALVDATLDADVDEALVGGPAEVVVEFDERTDVLTVAVNALVAVAGGAHAVEVVAVDGTTTIVPVETGLFADGRVEIAGDGIEEGTVVVAAAR